MLQTQIEPTTSEPWQLRRQNLNRIVGSCVCTTFGTVVALLFVIPFFHFLVLSMHPLKFVLQFTDLCLVDQQFGFHLCTLCPLRFHMFLIQPQTVGDFGARLSCKDFFEICVREFLRLDSALFVSNTFCLLNNPLLQCLDLVDETVYLGIRTFELTPPLFFFFFGLNIDLFWITWNIFSKIYCHSWHIDISKHAYILVRRFTTGIWLFFAKARNWRVC